MLLADEDHLLTRQLLEDAIAGTWTGSPTAEEQAAGMAALDRLTRQLGVSSHFMDGYLRASIPLPISAGDAVATTLEDCCLALARCGLSDDSDNATERMDRCCEAWRAWLRDVAAGKVQLVVTDTSGTASAAPARIRTGQIGSAYDWSRFGSRL